MASRLRSIASAFTGAAAAAGAMYYFDATSGRRRRARLGERSASTARHLASRLRIAGRDLGNRAAGLAARTSALVRPGRVDPTVLTERVRTCLGRVVSHPGAIEVAVEPGRVGRGACVALRGAVLAWEHERLLMAVRGVPGVAQVRDELSAYDSAEHVSALQGGVPRPPRRPALLRSRWSPGLRLAMAVAGGTLLVSGSRRRGPMGTMRAAAGGALLLRSAMNVPLRDIARGRGQHVEVRKTLLMRAPRARVFALFNDFERLPGIARHLIQVRRRADSSSHWVMSGPWGIPVEWDAMTTQVEIDRLIAWRTLGSSAVQHWGMLRFEDGPNGDTRVHVYLCYEPPAGRLGQAVARAFGADPASGLGQDLLRLKGFLERERAADVGDDTAAAASEAAEESMAEDIGEAGDQPDQPLGAEPASRTTSAAGAAGAAGVGGETENGVTPSAWMQPASDRRH